MPLDGEILLLCCGAERVKSPSEQSGAASGGGGSKNQVHERERSGSRVGGRRNANEAVRAERVTSPLRSAHMLYIRISWVLCKSGPSRISGKYT